MGELAAGQDVSVRSLNMLQVNGSQHSNWAFLILELEDGETGIGECTLDSGEDFLAVAFDRLQVAARGRTLSGLREMAASAASYPAPLPNSAVVSALDQAVWDVVAVRAGQPLWRLLGGWRPSIDCYANINRGLGDDRSPEAFGALAMDAVTAGFRAVKCAPFDGVFREAIEETDVRQKVERGLDRIAAVRAALPPDRHLMVDCHWRFDARTAVMVLKALEEFDPYWVEAPVAEHDLEAWRSIRQTTDLRLAGGEMFTHVREFRQFLTVARVDVVLPDVKYVGGIDGLRRVAALADGFGAMIAPHNPSGPVASLASAHVMSGLQQIDLLEWPWGESEIRHKLSRSAERIEEGALLLPERPGLGFELDPEVARAHPASPTAPTVSEGLFG